MTALRVGTRGSALALAQTRAIADRLGKASGMDVELVTVTTHGDTSRDSLASLGGTGVFASALRESLLAGECDVIVHSLKDLPTASYPGIELGAVPKRADARDVLCARDGLTLRTLPAGARIGTGSPRRRAQLQATRGDVEIVDIRGNVDSRLARVGGAPESAGDGGVPVTDDRRLDAVILAAAGLDRLGRAEAVTEHFSLSDWPTAPGQGALAIEVRSDRGSDADGRTIVRGLAAIDHARTHATAAAERAVLAGLEAGCAAPVGVSAIVDDGLLFVTATVYRLDGSERLSSSQATTLEGQNLSALLAAGAETADRVVAELLDGGAAEFAPLGGIR